MHEIEIDQRKNRLYLIMNSSDRVEIKACVEKIEDACKMLVPGFTCIVAFLKNNALKQRDEDLLFHIEDLVYAYGAKKIVRVRKNGSAIDRFHTPMFYFQPAYFAANAATIEEAEEILDSMKTRRVREKETSAVFSG
ncbi:MAG: hypothetical protein JRI75_09275 [Deltaproteobacteria bacterium]|nr:hypothetical protein [Deltaproteobacteria bacterium]